MERQRLMTPGPTPVPEEVMQEMAKPIIHHRTPEYRSIFEDVKSSLKDVFKTKNDVLIFASSGTGAMEASVANLLSAGDKAIVVRGGKFGERFADICSAYGVRVIPLDVEWGTAPDPAKIEQILDKEPGVKAVFTTLCETSTATVYDIKSIGSVVRRHKAALVVDVISGLGADDFQQDAWSVDIAAGGSQKGLMLPPGLSFCAVSEKAWGLIEQAKLPRYYFDLKKYKSSSDKSDVPYTPAITLVIGLKKALDIIKAKGVDRVIRDCAGMGDRLKKRAKEMGLSLFSKSPSNAVTAFLVPDGIDGAELIKQLKAKGITVAGGQDHLKGKIFRVAHMGAITEKDIDVTVDTIGEILKELRAR